MNLAFPALCILLLALPGILFRKAYARAAVPVWMSTGGNGGHVENKYPVSVRPITEEVSISLGWTIVLHVLWLTLVTSCGWNPDYGLIIRIIHGSSNMDGAHYQDALDYLAKNRVGVVQYFLSLYAVSFFAGRTCLWVVRGLHLDHNLILVRLEDQWFYFLRGEIFRFIEFRKFLRKPQPKISGTYLSVVLAQTGRDYLYKGFLWDFHLDRKGDLDRLVMHHTIRSEFIPEKVAKTAEGNGGALPLPAKDPSAKERLISDSRFDFQSVTSQLFTVRYPDCKTLSCTYFYIRQKKGKGGALGEGANTVPTPDLGTH